MHVTFWGTRGSIPKPGLTTIRYGGNTSCVEVRTKNGSLIIIDCGSGAHGLGQKLIQENPKGIKGHLLISHTHWDHIQGLPFFAPLFMPGNEWQIYGPKGVYDSIQSSLSGQMQYTYFPVNLNQVGSKITYHDLVEGCFQIDDVKIRTHYLNHPLLTIGYRIECDGAVLVYSCDHEPFPESSEGVVSANESDHIAFVRGADLLIHDAQYSLEEYPEKKGWGHSPYEYTVDVAKAGGVKCLALSHHDPLRDDDSLDLIVKRIRNQLKEENSSLEVMAAAEGQTVVLEGSAVKATEGPDLPPAKLELNALVDHSVLLYILDENILKMIKQELGAEHDAIYEVDNPEQMMFEAAKVKPSLMILDNNPTLDSGLKLSEAIHKITQDIPIILISDSRTDVKFSITDWLIKPFSSAYARTKMQSWILRSALRWVKAPIPADEVERLETLKKLGLGRDAEEKFDRLTRLAATVCNTPVALVTIVDETKQWFKSCYGFNLNESPREISFCAHVVYERDNITIPDTLLDFRFADNPAVVTGPRIRFYAGSPLILADGSCVGSLCVVDSRPRILDPVQVSLLDDIRGLVVAELNKLLLNLPRPDEK